MSDDIQTRSFDMHPFGHRWSNPPRPGLAYDAPEDTPEEHRLTKCRACGVERVVNQSCWSCFEAPGRFER